VKERSEVLFLKITVPVLLSILPYASHKNFAVVSVRVIWKTLRSSNRTTQKKLARIHGLTEDVLDVKALADGVSEPLEDYEAYGRTRKNDG
jgi:hypothetical protein